MCLTALFFFTAGAIALLAVQRSWCCWIVSALAKCALFPGTSPKSFTSYCWLMMRALYARVGAETSGTNFAVTFLYVIVCDVVVC